MSLNCTKCGEIDHVFIDGYPFGDRLLEGVLFKVEDKNGKPHAIGVAEESAEYFSGLNEKKWLKECEAFCLELDIIECPICYDEILGWAAPEEIKKATIVKFGLPDILGG